MTSPIKANRVNFMRTQLNRKLKQARSSGCIEHPRHCAVLWDTIEELSATIYHSEKKLKSKPRHKHQSDLYLFCDIEHWEDECSSELFQPH
tara:strand:- start:2468 stop:2740 length:273 start_codon:yes stop_codon:yes gene_type:complete